MPTTIEEEMKNEISAYDEHIESVVKRFPDNLHEPITKLCHELIWGESEAILGRVCGSAISGEDAKAYILARTKAYVKKWGANAFSKRWPNNHQF